MTAVETIWPRQVQAKARSIGESFDAIYLTMREDMQGVFSRDDPVAVARGLAALRSAYKVLISNGHDEYRLALADLKSGLDSVHADCVRLLAARLNDPATLPEDRALIRQFFAEERA
jgi:hypothetical protein